MPPAVSTSADAALPQARRGSDWLDELTVDATSARALAILLQAVVRDAEPRAITTARQLQRALGDG